jgi:cytidylate kinase
MTVWTIAAQEGTGGGHVASALAAAAGVPLLDRHTLAGHAHELEPDTLGLDDVEGIEERLGGRLHALAFGLAMTNAAVAAEALQELQLRHRLPKLARAVLADVAREPCVILAPVAFAALAEHPGAIHVRLHAPLACRVAAYAREHVVNAACAEKAVRHDDRVKSAWVRSIYGADLDDDRRFTLALDTSRFSTDRLVETLLAAGGANGHRELGSTRLVSVS